MFVRKKIVLVTLLLLVCIAYTACRKKSDPPENVSEVQITVQSPLNGQLYRKGDTVNVAFNVSYITELHGYYVQLIDTTTEDVLYENAVDIHDDHFSVQLQWADTCTQARNLQLIINANLDHVGTEASDTVWIATTP